MGTGEGVSEPGSSLMPASLLKHDDYVVLNRPYAVRGPGRRGGVRGIFDIP